MHTRSKLALTALLAMSFVEFAPTAAMAEICLNKPPQSLVDQSTEDSDAMQRIEALGNRCVYSTRTGRRITPSIIQDFLQENPDAEDISYSTPLVTR